MIFFRIIKFHKYNSDFYFIIHLQPINNFLIIDHYDFELTIDLDIPLP